MESPFFSHFLYLFIITYREEGEGVWEISIPRESPGYPSFLASVSKPLYTGVEQHVKENK
jgi:hypothetical protein